MQGLYFFLNVAILGLIALGHLINNKNLGGFLLFLTSIPYVAADIPSAPFPDLLFGDFSEFVVENFGTNISLSTVLVILLSVTNNTELLSLHFKQNNKGYSTSWIRALSRALKEKLGYNIWETLFLPEDNSTFVSDNDIVTISKKLDAFSKKLKIYPYSRNNKFTGTLKPISHDILQPALLICPISSVCLTAGCNYSFLQQKAKDNDIPRVSLIKGTTIHSNVHVISGKCQKCKTIYHADHERSLPLQSNLNEGINLFLNNARYVKIGQNLWADRNFSRSVIHAMHDLHASASGYRNFFAHAYGNDSLKLFRRHIAAAFVQESTRGISQESGIEYSFQAKTTMKVDEITHDAFRKLGNDGVIHLAETHSCDECLQPFRNLLGTVDPNAKGVRMVVIDGIVVGPKVIINFVSLKSNFLSIFSIVHILTVHRI